MALRRQHGHCTAYCSRATYTTQLLRKLLALGNTIQCCKAVYGDNKTDQKNRENIDVNKLHNIIQFI